MQTNNHANSRPLFEHIRNHDALFSQLALIRNQYAQHLGLEGYDFHKTPKFIAADGTRLHIEPERSIIVPDYHLFSGLKHKLAARLPGLHIVEQSEAGFRYPTAAIAGLDAPYIKRFRSEFFHRLDEDRHICRPINLSLGVKSRGKGDDRIEYEVWLPDEQLDTDATPLFIDKYAEDIPYDVIDFVQQPSCVYGWMGVKRAAFDAIYIDRQEFGDIAINIGLSVDAYNIGARPDLAYSPLSESSIAAGNAEFEWEVMGYYAPRGAQLSQTQIWDAIYGAINVLSAPLEDMYGDQIMPVEASKTERILLSIQEHGYADDEIRQWDLQPHEFLQTRSDNRKKAHDPARHVNLLGRLNRLFYQPEHKLPSLLELHDLIAR